MKVVSFIEEIDNISPSLVEDQTKIDYINQLEDYIFSEIVEEQKSIQLDLVKDKNSYDLPDIKFNDILKVLVNNNEYKKMFLADNDPSSYFENGDKFGINPIPSESATNGITIIYRNKPTIKTYDNVTSDELTIVSKFGIRFKELYTNYLLYKICIDTEEFGKANNYIALFNEALANFSGWYYDNMPNVTIIKRARRWR